MSDMRISALVGCALALGALTACGSAPDYAGEGHGDVVVQVKSGDSAAAIGRALKAAGVVESVDAFVKAAANDPAAAGIQPGSYKMHLQMSSAAALKILDDTANVIRGGVLVTPGMKVSDVISAITANSKLTREQVVAALSHPGALGLPAWAHGDVEGFLGPATYTVAPGESATQVIRRMVAAAVDTYTSLDLETRAAKVGLTPEQVVTVASILEKEARRSQDFPKVARAIYNRLKITMPLQSDATVAYANKLSGAIWTTPAQRNNASPYNTYQHTGLPPGPINSPGRTTLNAALSPAAGPWLYWVVVNLQTGETVFSTTFAEHQLAIQQFQQYCQTQSASHCGTVGGTPQ